jgi:4,5-dihydroxyphthalate decarboxylase
MTDLQLSLATGRCLRFDALISGRVRPQGVAFVYSQVHPSELFWRQLTFAEFDVSEMSLSSLFIAWSRGVRDWVALPVFPRREFFHARIMVRDGCGVEHPADLAGRRVGVPEYQQTAAVWSRGVLSDEFGVSAADIEWFMERPPQLSHGSATAFIPPQGVRLRYITPSDTMTAMVDRNELEAVLLFITEPTLADRSVRAIRSAEGMHPLFADAVGEIARYYGKTGILPVNHCVVVRRALVEQHPWLPLNLYAAFDAARRAAHEEARAYVRLAAQLGRITLDSPDAEADPFPYGLAPNRRAIDALLRYQVEQGLIDKAPVVEDVFAPSTQNL